MVKVTHALIQPALQLIRALGLWRCHDRDGEHYLRSSALRDPRIRVRVDRNTTKNYSTYEGRGEPDWVLRIEGEVPLYFEETSEGVPFLTGFLGSAAVVVYRTEVKGHPREPDCVMYFADRPPERKPRW